MLWRHQWSSILRASISAVGRTLIDRQAPYPRRRTFDPSELIKLETRVSMPLTTDEIAITVETPITMPSTVRPERSLLVRNVSSEAIFTDSLVWPVLATGFSVS